MKAGFGCTWIWVICVGVTPAAVSGGANAGDEVVFEHVVVDAAGPRDPWAKIVADIDGDGFLDIVVGGRNGPLVWYAYPKWTKAVIAEGGYKTVDGEAGDMDGDGDTDIVMGGLVWYENPRRGGRVPPGLWKAHKVADHATHDVEVGDLDGDGRLDIVTRDQSEFGAKAGNRIYVWRRHGAADEWAQQVIDCPHGEGLKLHDLDADGDLDIVIGGMWFANGGDTAAEWKGYSFCQWHPNATVQVADVNGDGRADVILSPSELKGNWHRISWFEAPADRTAGGWRQHVIADHVECVIHGLAAADMNGDGMVDVVASEMHQGEDPDEVAAFFNRQKGGLWARQVVSGKGSHYIQVADIDADGDMDIVGANWSGGYQPIELWRNMSAHADHR